MIQLEDGSIIPSNLTIEPMTDTAKQVRMNLALRTGIVTNIYYTDDEKNLSKKFIEYDVMIASSEMHNGLNLSLYRNCRQNDLFGSSNNYLRYTLQEGEKKKDGTIDKGASVLVYCIDGVTDAGSAVIIGGIPDTSKTAPTYKKEDGQFYDFMFNGINYKIDKDGQLSIKFNSPIDHEGKKLNEKAAGSEILIDKEGQIIISDNEKQVIKLSRADKKISLSNEKESIVIDKEAKTISITASENVKVTANKDIEMKSTGATKIEATKDLEMKGKSIKEKADSSIDIKAGSALNLEAGSAAKLKAAQVNIQADSMAQIKGTMTLLGEGTMPVGIAGVSMSVGVGNLGIPIQTLMITGSATVFAGA